MTNEEIQQLIRLAQDSRVAELEVQRGENRVRIRLAGSASEVVAAPSPVAFAAAPAAPAPAAAPVATAPVAGDDPLTDPTVVIVKSPIVGTFYDRPSPDSAPFIKVGDAVHVGKVLCIIESMKLMNEIECEYSGTIVAKLASNLNPVEYGEALFALKPNK